MVFQNHSDGYLEEMSMFFARGKSNVMSASRPTIYGLTTFKHSFDSLMMAVEAKDRMRRILEDIVAKEQIRRRILEPHSGPRIEGLRTDFA